MASIALAEKSVVALKNCLREEFPDAKSSHITEALAYSLGFRTHASLRAALDKPEPDPLDIAGYKFRPTLGWLKSSHNNTIREQKRLALDK